MADTESAGGRLSWTGSPVVRVGALTLVMACLAAVAVIVVPDSLHPATRFGGVSIGDTWIIDARIVEAVMIVLLGVAFTLAEQAVFQVVFRRESISFSLSEIPLVLGLVFVAPAVAIAVRLVGSIPVLVLRRRNRGLKLAFNVALFALETALAHLVFRWLLTIWDHSSAGMVVAGMMSAVAMTLLTTTLISTAISAYEGGLRQRIVTEFSSSWWLYPVGSILGAMTLALALVEPLLAALAAAPATIMWSVLNRFGALNQDLRDLDALHGFSDRVGSSLDPHIVGEVAVDELFEVLRATGVALVRFGPDRAVEHRRGDIDLRLPSSPFDPDWADLLAADRTQVVTSERFGIEMGAGTGPVPVLVGALRDAGGTIGAVVAVEQWATAVQLIESERSRLDNLVSQLTVGLRRALLHGQIEHEARHDALTGLPGRTVFESAVRDAVATPVDGVQVVMILDLDRFKEVNDTLGHQAGDRLLVEFAGRLRNVMVGRDDVVARLSGDEFAILCRRSTHDEVLEAARSVVRRGGEPIDLDGIAVVVTVSIGVAEILPTDTDALQPMRRADIAMYDAKWQRSGVETYRDEIDRRGPARLSIRGDLRTAIERDQLDVVFQPKVDLRTGAVVGAEALVRWEHRLRGVVAPTDFVRVAEETGLITDLTDIVLTQATEALAEFRRNGLSIGLSVNLSTHDLLDAGLAERIAASLVGEGIDRSALTLELTESSLLVDSEKTRVTLERLHDAGFRLAVDDFGIGYSSLSRLRHLPVDELKIDQSFVGGMLANSHDEVIVKSTIDLAHNLGLVVVAEGAETNDIVRRLTEIGCDLAQGYGIARPMTLGDFVAWVAAFSPASRPG